ncbi:kinase-like domain-containing protein [Chytriomyces sp. MP71]|nr:kinase-like domain-containing protein [Chytriomyces sp. MP71]
MVEIPVPSLSGDTSKLASVTAVVPDVSTAPSSPVPDPDRPTIFTSEDIEPPIRRDIRWLKGDMIGKGSFGRVFYGVNLTTQDVMAVKQIDVIPISRYRNKAEAQKNRAKMIDSLRTEILLLNELHHENVVRYLGFDIDNTVVSVFLEYVSGGSVASMISRFGKFEEDLAQSLLVQILTGLEYLHERSVIHRDIKGGNILVNLDGTAKISDFGVSKKNELNMAYQLNSGLDFAGSVFWMAPEMSKNLGYSAKIDIWALGCVALEMLSGAHPWNGKGHMQAMYELRQGHSPPIPTGLTRGALSFLAHCFRM